ncbi:response regulator transcription factor [Conexibacter sp. JD483]|uniref:response regulator transcription factor n=1 Tax=unclassified Conexibacter TaxID=2627773 RepID=UPI002722D83B|nr:MULTISPECIES: response regulator transcription factor [unclassified Conexibacter]MDO8184905.1 response regulator transcription factor [Conexibacter sp. CPCC 205706]MDO8198049.1 response regulator transcription factor [Conexibacter sp. CPCC 205762]MDR9372036.1 response regulator transcription factor [Conexibacter sp. JD483]
MGTEPEAVAPGFDGRVDVLVVDEHDPSRLGLALLLRRQPWVRRCALATDQREAAELVRRDRPDVAVVDISNAGPFVGLVVETLRAPHPGLRLLLTARCATVSCALLRHVDAPFLPYGTPGRELVEGVLAAVREAAPAAASGQPVADDPLTPRERDVLTLLATGATNREIAAQLHLGPDSIKKHASAIYRKLGVRNRTEAVQRYAQLPRSGTPRA